MPSSVTSPDPDEPEDDDDEEEEEPLFGGDVPPGEDLRRRVDAALERLISDQDLQELIAANLAVTKRARGWCRECNHFVWVEIPDAKASVSALEILMNQAKGRPDIEAREQRERITFIREVHE